jgi:prepilin-type N-terminal cleavage/methylation domain-containing protein
MSKHHPTLKYNSGMTLVELLVVLAIFILVSGLTIFDYGQFRSSVSLQNLADDIALSVRRAQNYAIGVQGSQSGTPDFTNGYGIHFSTDPSPGDPLWGSNRSFVLFSDTTKDRLYNYPAGGSVCANGTNECVDLLNITTNDEILSICSSGSCYTRAYISFLRPNPDAFICLTNDNTTTCASSFPLVDVTIRNIQTMHTKIVRVSTIGQISVE